jgi:TolB-like protein/Tfp pilus assembly protein PilF
MSSAENKAVFLSYASQDAEAAKRICDALRAAGVEVWFDQNELVGGDAWDAKIRGQISSCALFVPIISANTQARLEGYFRIEWKLAARRTYAIASAKAFLLPIVIDDTRDAAAHVPDEFREVQWTRLPGGEPTPKFCAHVQRLLGSPAAAVEAADDLQRPPVAANPGRRPSSGRTVGLAAGAVLAAVLVAAGIYWVRRTPGPPVRPAPAAARTTPDTEAQRLVQQAQALLARSDELNRQNLQLAEELVTRALALEPTNADAVVLSAQISCNYVWYLFDNSATRREQLQQQAARAAALAPDSTVARLAQVNAQSTLFFNYSEAPVAFDLEKEARALVALEPRNWRTHRALGSVLRTLNRREESVAAMRVAYEVSDGNADAAADLINVLVRSGLYAEADVVRARAMAGVPVARLLCWDVMLKLRWHGDPTAASEAVKAWPGWLVQEDRGLFHRWQAHYWGRRPVEAERLARMAVRDMVKDFSFYGPTAVLRALSNEMAGNREAALADWRVALEKSERELQAEANNEPGLYWKAWALARLGRTEEAKAIVALLAQRGRGSQFAKVTYLEALQVAVGDKAAAFAGLRRRMAAPEDSLGVTRAVLELDPAYDSVRNDPEFQALLRDAPAPPAAPSAAASAPAADEKSIAVLAFANLSDDRANEAFSDGISEELLNVLAKVPGLKVSARTSAFHFKGKDTPIPEIARQLGVAYVIEGSVRRAGDKVRITAQLVKAADGFRLWSDTFTRDLKDVFAVQDEIAGLIARNLSLQIGGGAPAAEALDAEVLPLYYSAQQAWNLRTVAGMDRAEELLERALKLAPNFARGHALLAKVWVIRGELTDTLSPFGLRDGELARKIRAKVDYALQLDPSCAEAHGALGVLNWDTWRPDDAAAALRRATQLNPNYASAHQWLGRVRSSQGYLDEGIASLRRAVEVDPLSQRILDNCGRLLLFAGEAGEALQLAERAIALQPNAAQAQALKAQALATLGRVPEALQIALTLPSEASIVSVQKVQVLVRGGRLDEVERILPGLTGGNILAKLGALAALGRKDEALAALDSDWFSANRADVLLFEPLLDPLRGEPQFQRLLERLALTDAHARAQAWRAAHGLKQPTSQP